MNKRAQGLADAREDERTRSAVAERVVAREKWIREDQRRRMIERKDLTDRSDDTGFTPGVRGLI